MAYGGTAKTYANWQLAGEPFEENKKLYIYVINPTSNLQKKVRWYSDAAHEAFMPKSEHKEIPLFSLFGFDSENDYILCIRKIDLTEEEEKLYFHYNWKHGGKWTVSVFFGGVWYAPKDAEIPPIAKIDKVFRVTWPLFKEEGKKNSVALGYKNGAIFW